MNVKSNRNLKCLFPCLSPFPAFCLHPFPGVAQPAWWLSSSNLPKLSSFLRFGSLCPKEPLSRRLKFSSCILRHFPIKLWKDNSALPTFFLGQPRRPCRLASSGFAPGILAMRPRAPGGQKCSLVCAVQRNEHVRKPTRVPVVTTVHPLAPPRPTVWCLSSLQYQIWNSGLHIG